MAFDENLPPDVDSVLSATAMLDITEWDFFNLAYDRWHGRPAAEDVMEPIFAAYMFDNVVPVWARHFARMVERRYRRGTLDRHALGVERPSSRRGSCRSASAVPSRPATEAALARVNNLHRIHS